MAVATRHRHDYAVRRAQRASIDAARQLAAILLLTVAVVALVAILLSGSILAYGMRHDSAVYSGVSAAGVELGGKSRSEAVAALDARWNEWADAPIAFQLDTATLSATPAELGVRFDAAATAERAYAFGRGGTLWQETRHWLDAMSGGHEVAPVYQVDADTFGAWLEAEAAELVRAPRNASFQLSADGGIRVEPAREGISVDIQATWERFLDRVSGLSSEPVTIATHAVAPATTDAETQAVLDRVDALAGSPLELTLDGYVWQIPANDLLAMLHVTDEGDALSVELDREDLHRFIRALAPAAFVSASDASVRNDDGTFAVVPPVIGHKLDVDATTDAALAALERGDAGIELVTAPVEPNITQQEAEQALADTQRLLANPVTVTWDGGSATLDSAKLAKAVVFDVNASRNPAIRVSFDEEQMRRALALVANDVRVEGVNADLRWIDGQVQVRTPETMGRELDLQATINAVVAKLEAGGGELAIVTKDLPPAVTAAMAGNVQIRDRLAHGTTEYGSSSPARFHNVELASSRVNGAMVPPGGTFSFNVAVGPVTFDSGYRTGYGIVATNGSISTIPSVGGGICQVATTVFQSAFWAGMPIEERSWHLYWIPRYGQPPSGMKGLDATVDPDYDLDFKFTNTTNDWIALRALYDGAYLTFELWGTNQGWQVDASQPTITNIRPASQEMVYEQSSELPAGQSVFVEHAEDGFDASIHRVVRKDGQVIHEQTFFSTYAPARNVTLVGTGQ